MTIKDIVKLCAVYLNKEDLLKDEQFLSNQALRETNVLTVCANVVISELACSYLPLIKSEKVTANGKRVYYSSLNERALEILSVKDEQGEDLSFTVLNEYVTVPQSQVVVEYRYLPSNYGLCDEIGYAEEKVPLRLIAYGTIAEYLLTERAFEESLTWRNRYNDMLSIMVLPKNSKIRPRSFV